jgi:hypothetical protein
MSGMRPFSFSLFLFALAAASTALATESQHFASGPARTALVELYTSEGCSSCPPAERWLGELRDHPGLWRDFVPVAFHVDYWNRLGWPDRFSTKDFTQRQYDHATAWGNGSVYTPCFVRDGAEWRPAGKTMPAMPGAAAGTLAATYDGATLHVDFTPAGARGPAQAGYEVHAALLGGGIVSKVTAGENSGATLHHDFIALALVHGATGADLALPQPKLAGVPRRGLAVWVTRRGELTPLQATGGWLTP